MKAGTEVKISYGLQSQNIQQWKDIHANETIKDLKGKLFKAKQKMDDKEKEEEKRGSQTLSGVLDHTRITKKGAIIRELIKTLTEKGQINVEIAS